LKVKDGAYGEKQGILEEPLNRPVEKISEVKLLTRSSFAFFQQVCKLLSLSQQPQSVL